MTVPTPWASQLRELLDSGASYAAAAREIGQPYSRVYGWAIRNGIVAQRGQEYRTRVAVQLKQNQRDRQRLYELCDAYRRGELVPGHLEGLKDIPVVIHDELCVRRSVAEFERRFVPPRESYEALVRVERQALDELEGLIYLREREWISDRYGGNAR